MVGLFQLRAGALLAILATTQCSAGDDSSSSSSLISKQPAPAMTHSAYFTEMMVQSDSLEPAKCSDRVLEARRTATITQGVKPTVSLQAALLIFLGVGIFAVFIAQSFQMVRKYVYRDYQEGDVDQEGMDIEYFSQYKEREEFDGRTGMFQGEYGEGDPDMEGEGEYEEEA